MTETAGTMIADPHAVAVTALVDDALSEYVRQKFGPGASIDRVERIGGDAGVKAFGYGDVVRLYLCGAPHGDVVVHTARRGGFGHDTLADRAAEALLPWETFNLLPGHVRALDVGSVDAGGRLSSLGEVRDFFLVTAYGEGEPYFLDLERIAKEHVTTDEDEARVDRLAEQLATIHREKHDAPSGGRGGRGGRELWQRRMRELVGHHECIAGLIDSYDGHQEPGVPDAAELRRIEHWAVEWRYRLRPLSKRLCRVHGDFHPWNVLFDGGGKTRRLTLLDRSRGEWGEAADDLAAMSINYVFFALRAGKGGERPFVELFRRFFRTYLHETKDAEVLSLLPPFFVWRALVVASPVWYPELPVAVRKRIFEMVSDVMAHDTLDLERVTPFFSAS